MERLYCEITVSALAESQAYKNSSIPSQGLH